MKCCIFLLVLAAATASAWSDDQRQPRMLGNTAVMHVYYYAPKTLEVTFVDSFLFKDEQSCKEAIPKALMIATPYASEGDLVSASVHRHESARGHQASEERAGAGHDRALSELRLSQPHLTAHPWSQSPRAAAITNT